LLLFFNAFSATLNTFSKAMADEFFKRWRQRKNKNDKPWGDDEMLEACDFDKRQILEDLGFPPLANEKGVECPRGIVHTSDIPSSNALKQAALCAKSFFSYTQLFQVLCSSAPYQRVQ
jgi:hypothetical protein